MKYVREFLDVLPKGAKILDAGCGEGILIEEYRSKGYDVKGIDLNYESELVERGNILELPYQAETFDFIILLDVFEHFTFTEQPRALKEISRVLKKEGQLLISIPNLSHLGSRVRFLLKGEFHRTDCVENHLGERPMRENIKLLQEHGFFINSKTGITLALPFIYTHLICRWPACFIWLHDILDLIAIPEIALLNLFLCTKK